MLKTEKSITSSEKKPPLFSFHDLSETNSDSLMKCKEMLKTEKSITSSEKKPPLSSFHDLSEANSDSLKKFKEMLKTEKSITSSEKKPPLSSFHDLSETNSDSQKKVTLKNSCPEDKLNLLNPEEEKQYSSDFLQQLQSHPLFLIKYATCAASLPTVENDSNQDMNKSVAASQERIFPNAGKPTLGYSDLVDGYSHQQINSRLFILSSMPHVLQVYLQWKMILRNMNKSDLASISGKNFVNAVKPTLGYSDLVDGYSHQYGTCAASLSTVANYSNPNMNKSVAASQQGMYPNAGMPTSGQHHQTMGGPVPSPAIIMQTVQPMSRNPPITLPVVIVSQKSISKSYNVPRSMPSMARNHLAPVVNQPGQQPSSQFSHMSMVQPAFHPPLPLVVNQFPQSMYPQRHTPEQYPAMISPGQHLYVNSYNFNTPPSQNSNGNYPTHGMSSYQSIQPQMAPQTIPPPQLQQQPAQHRKGGKAIPVLDPNTCKNIFTTEKITDESDEKNDKSIGVQFASQVAAVLNDNSNEQPSKPQAESIRITESLNISSEKETMMNEEPPVSELVDELANIEDLSEIELIENQHNTFNDTSIVYYRKDIEENVKEHIDNSTSYQKVDTECVIQDNEQIADTVLEEQPQLVINYYYSS
ncbi:eukaryotic translation initiation factor 4 gamma 3 [Caerostris extrusa]|uniref:Eukaryotic translation initiation factor 4 gamma 3 n=1 Tax=Caerostris extrusa TaxID=172846 RepID=A0AAV4XRY9_CAEEX|nr:hypothetical protein CEXT_758935 [Caerostris extrusa]GIY97926.1 eukaryotic translation initiation factor 4 gamma 3 [Caerostris extrusa]